MKFLRWLQGLAFVRAFELGGVRHLATAASGFVLAWLLSHHAAQGDASNIAQGLGSVIVGGAGYLFSMIGTSNGQAREQAAAQTGRVVSTAEAKAILKGEQAQSVTDQAQADKTQAAMDAAGQADANTSAADEMKRLMAGKA